MIYLFTIMFQSYVNIPERKKKQYQRTGYVGYKLNAKLSVSNKLDVQDQAFLDYVSVVIFTCYLGKF